MRINRLFILTSFLITSLCSSHILGQGIAISNELNTDPHLSALLDMQSTDQGFLVPRMNKSERDSIENPAAGLLIYQLDLEFGFYFFNGTEWKPINDLKGVFEEEFNIGQSDPNVMTHILPGVFFETYLYDTSGTITDDGGLFANYSDNGNGRIILYGPDFDGDQIGLQLNILSLDLNESDTLSITISRGYGVFQTFKLTNQLNNFVLPIATEFASITFKSDASINDEGFEIRFDWMYLKQETDSLSTKNVGWFFNPFKAAMRGGIDFIDAWENDSLGRASFSYGQNLKVTGEESVSFGENNRVTGKYSGAIGTNNRVLNKGSFAYGASNETTGANSFAGGILSIAAGSSSVALGNSEAHGSYAVALGESIAQGQYSFALGDDNTAEGSSSVALGVNNSAIGDYSFVAGNSNEARSGYETVFGQYNYLVVAEADNGWSENDPLFVVGDGNFFDRHNALTIMKSGRTGIGTHRPDYPFEVKMDLPFSQYTVANFENTSSTTATIQLNASDSIPLKMIYNSQAARLDFNRASGTPLSMNWSIDNSGRVGIGTALPQSKLHVNGGLTVNDDIIAADAGGLSLKTDDGTVRLKMNDNGFFGIGTTFPQTLLHVNGAITINSEIRAANSVGLKLKTDDNIIRLQMLDNGYIGIGTISPQSPLHVNGRIEVDDAIIAQDAGGIAFQSDEGSTRIQMLDNGLIGIGITNPDAQLAITAQGTNDAMRVRTSAGTRFRIFNNGNTRIGINSGSNSSILNVNSPVDVSPFRSQVNSTVRLMVHPNGGVSVGSATAPSGDNGLHVSGSYAAKSGGGSWTATSDLRLKNVHGEYNGGLSELLKIRPVEYSYNEQSGYDTTETHIGVVAQELEEIAPYMIGSFDQEGENYLTVDNSAMIYMLINAVKEQQKKIEELERRLGGVKE